MTTETPHPRRPYNRSDLHTATCTRPALNGPSIGYRRSHRSTACGYLTKADGDKREGCHQYLARFLPRGTRLNLYGTQGTDTVFIHTYEGTAEA